jgi:hypothetical protein
MEESQAQEKSAPESVKPLRWPIYVYLFFDLCLLAAVGTYGYFSWVQWTALTDQARASEQNLSQVKAAADAAQRSADAAKGAADAAEQANRLAREAIMASERPYVFPDKVWLTARLIAGTKVTGLVKFINTGKLPALNFHAGGKFKVRDSLPGKLVASGQPPSLLGLAPGGSRIVQIGSDAAITDEEMEAVEEGKKSLYGYGIFVYEDGFGNQVAQPFCEVYDRKDKSFAECPQPSAEYHEGT